MTSAEAIPILRRYQKWRRGVDERTFAETGLTPEIIGQAIDTLLTTVTHQEKEILAGRSRLAKCQVQREAFHFQLRSKRQLPPSPSTP